MRIRHAIIEDAASISRVHVESWRTTYRGIVPDHVLDSLNLERNSIRWREMLSNMGEMKCLLVAENSQGHIIGFAAGGPNRELRTGFNGELYAIYILESYHGRNIGKKLVLKIADWLYRHKYTSMMVWVLEKNPAKHFYESMGGLFVSKKKIEIGQALLEEVSYGWTDLKVLLDRYSSPI
jgi:GNAT superfamily N-acetyltransferase